MLLSFIFSKIINTFSIDDYDRPRLLLFWLSYSERTAQPDANFQYNPWTVLADCMPKELLYSGFFLVFSFFCFIVELTFLILVEGAKFYHMFADEKPCIYELFLAGKYADVKAAHAVLLAGKETEKKKKVKK